METYTPRDKNGNILRYCYNCRDFESTFEWYGEWYCLDCHKKIDPDARLGQIPVIKDDY